MQIITGINDTVKLANGVLMPRFGLGVWQAAPEVTATAVSTAIQAGYPMIDAAKAYGNEIQVGEGIKQGLAATGKKRSDLFVTTKLANEDQGYESTLKNFDASLQRLGLDYLDLYLIHWPVAGKWAETWRAFEDLYKAGKVRAIGVCNFSMATMQSLIAQSEIAPMVDQVEFHPWLQQPELKKYLAETGIQQEAWSPLGGTGGSLMKEPVIQAIANKHGKSAAQILIRWDLENGLVTIPKSVHPEYIRQNADVFDFSLDEDDMKQLAAMNQNKRTSYWLTSFDWYFGDEK
ncbi:aldo/keto reductase [Furfurilactobacillus siliginis]|uniref:Oxidoreductase n=1 Tax=Furfurilactobacillus siliginis TaxID=348151 RepID=A0A510VXG3_9LACO|nr:aldo/keto reductase [Furfurilactobacillus siliginis]GEK29440.1 oxidoreductase [Furfurilactobacillus siliginis]